MTFCGASKLVISPVGAPTCESTRSQMARCSSGFAAPDITAIAFVCQRLTNTFGKRWQTNAMAVMSGAANPEEQRAIWERVLSQVGAPTGLMTNFEAPQNVITPYYGFYLLDAMARLDHRPEALRWMRQYWGGMLADGATSFWEAYDPRWDGGQDFHASLEADGKKGYYVSLAHGWSSGPTAWLMEQLLGIQPTAGGFREVSIRPDRAGLRWARGAEPRSEEHTSELQSLRHLVCRL